MIKRKYEIWVEIEGNLEKTEIDLLTKRFEEFLNEYQESAGGTDLRVSELRLKTDLKGI